MPDNIAARSATDDIDVIDTIVFEHEAIRHHLRTLNKIAKDEEALFLEMIGGGSPALFKSLEEKQLNLENYLMTLHEGVSRHEAMEESALPSLVGALLMEGFRMEHRELREQAGKVEKLLSLKDIAGLSPEALGKRAVELKFVLGYLGKVLEIHLTNEEVTLALIKRVLERSKAKAS